MKKSGFFILIFLVFCVPITSILASEVDKKRIINQEYSVDNYYEIDRQGNINLNVYLGAEKLVNINKESTNFLITDHLDSPTIIINQDNEIVEENDYDDFGNLRFSSSTIDNDYKFTGKELDTETGLQYSVNRYYDSVLARFLSIDPALISDPTRFLVDVQQLNSYAYAKNNPVKYVDPLGLTTKVYIEKGEVKDGWKSVFGHAFLAIDGMVYNWSPNAGRENNSEYGYYGEDMDITSWAEFTQRIDKQDSEFNTYTFETDKKQERDIRRFYLTLAEQNNALEGDKRFLYSPFYNCVDAVIDALKSGGILNQKFSAGLFISTPSKLKKELDFRYNLDQKNDKRFYDFYQRIPKNKVLKNIINKTIIKTNEE